MGNRIFISYRREGGDVTAKLICEALKNRGYKTFYDFDALKGGVFDEQIKNEIINCTDMVLVLPPNGLNRCQNENDWVRQEIQLALQHRKNIIPVMLHGFEFPEQLPEDIEQVTRYNGVRFYMEFFDAVIDRIVSKLSDIPEAPAPSKPERSEKKSPKSTPKPSKPTFISSVTPAKLLRFFGITILFLFAIGMFIAVAPLFVLGEDIDAALACSGFSAVFANAGWIWLTYRKKTGNKHLRCMYISLGFAVFSLLMGLIFVRYFGMYVVLPWLILFTSESILFFILAKLAPDRKKTVSIITSFIIVSLAIFTTTVSFTGDYYGAAIYKWHAEKGNPEAQSRLGFFYEYRNDPESAVLWYEKALAKGNRYAAESLAEFYFDGKVYPKNYLKATELLLYSERSTYQNSDLKTAYQKKICPHLFEEVDAETMDTNDIYYAGIIVLKKLMSPYFGYMSDSERLALAAGLLEEAAYEGHASAAYHLGRMYEEGNGVAVDYVKALELYNMAKENGYPYNVDVAIARVTS